MKSRAPAPAEAPKPTAYLPSLLWCAISQAMYGCSDLDEALDAMRRWYLEDMATPVE